MWTRVRQSAGEREREREIERGRFFSLGGRGREFDLPKLEVCHTTLFHLQLRLQKTPSVRFKTTRSLWTFSDISGTKQPDTRQWQSFEAQSFSYSQFLPLKIFSSFDSWSANILSLPYKLIIVSNPNLWLDWFTLQCQSSTQMPCWVSSRAKVTGTHRLVRGVILDNWL